MRDAGDTAALHEREPRFRAIFEAAAIGIGLFDLDGRPVETNLAFQRLLGYSAEELRGMPFPAFTHPEDLEADLALARELIAGQRDTYQIEKRYVRKDGAVIWGRLTVSLVRDAAGTPRYAIGMVEDITERVSMCTRRDALLRLARHLAVETAPDRVMHKLLGEAVALTGGRLGPVAGGDEPRQVLHPVWNTLPIPDEPVDLRLGEGAGGQAAARREPVVINDYQAAAVAVALARRAGLRAMVAAPLLHGARLLGVVTVASTAPGKRFAPEDAGLLEVLAGLASAVLVGIERSRLEGALLAARTAQHALNNQLSAVVGYADLLTEDPRLLEELRLLAQEILVGAQDAARTVQQLGQIARLEEVHRGGPGPVLD